MIKSLNRSILMRLMVFVGFATFFLPAATGIYLYSSFKPAIAVTIDNDLRKTATVLLHRLAEDHRPVDKELLDVGEHLLLRITDPDRRGRIESLNMAHPVPLGI